MISDPLAVRSALVVIAEQGGRIDQFAEHFQKGGGQISVSGVVIGCLAVAVLGVIYWRLSQYMARRDGCSYRSSRRLFQELCRGHQLDWRSRRLLRRLSCARGLDDPVHLFLTPECFQMEGLPADLRRAGRRLGNIKRRLFDDLDQLKQEV